MGVNKLQIFASVLYQISQKDKTYMNILSSIGDELTDMAEAHKPQVADQQTALFEGV